MRDAQGETEKKISNDAANDDDMAQGNDQGDAQDAASAPEDGKLDGASKKQGTTLRQARQA